MNKAHGEGEQDGSLSSRKSITNRMGKRFVEKKLAKVLGMEFICIA